MGDGDREQEGGSMFLRRASGAKLISAAIATEIARLILKEQHGQSELDRNEPLSVVEDGATWVVQGNESKGANAAIPPSPSWAGPFKMRISQFNGRILDCVFLIDMAKAAQTARPDSET